MYIYIYICISIYIVLHVHKSNTTSHVKWCIVYSRFAPTTKIKHDPSRWDSLNKLGAFENASFFVGLFCKKDMIFLSCALFPDTWGSLLISRLPQVAGAQTKEGRNMILLGACWSLPHLRRCGTGQWSLQHAATCCNMLHASCCIQRAATCCNVLQHAAAHCNALQHHAPHCTTLHHTAPHCTTTHHSTVQLNATPCTTLQHAAPHCTTLHNTAPHCTTLHHTAPCHNTLQHAASCKGVLWCLYRCTTLHSTATHCNTLQHTATHYQRTLLILIVQVIFRLLLQMSHYVRLF